VVRGRRPERGEASFYFLAVDVLLFAMMTFGDRGENPRIREFEISMLV